MIDDAKLDELAAKAKAVVTRHDSYGQQCQAEEAFTMAADPETIAALVAEVKQWRAVRTKVEALRSTTTSTGSLIHDAALNSVLAIIDAAAGEA